MNTKLKASLFWSFLPLGAIMAWLSSSMSPSQLLICSLLYGLFMVMAGLMVGIAHAREKDMEVILGMQEEARNTKASLVSATEVLRRVVSKSSDVVALSVAERMVNELMTNPQNEEQFIAAQQAAKRIADEESKKVKSQVGCGKP